MVSTTTHSQEDDNAAKFDNLFLTIAEGARGIENLMDSFFSFLARKTDFFVAGGEQSRSSTNKSAEARTSDEDDPSLAVTLQYYTKHRVAAIKRHEKEQEMYKKIDAERRKKRLEEESVSRRSSNRAGPPAGVKPSGLTIEEIVDKNESRSDGPAGTTTARLSAERVAGTGQELLRSATVAAQRPSGTPLEEKMVCQASTSDSITCNADNKQTAADDDGAAPIGNGGTTDKYTWTQLLPSVDVYIPVPAGTIARNCKVTLTAHSLRVIVNGEVIIDGELHQKIRPDDSLWTLEDGRTLHLVLEKTDAMRWWSSVIVGDPSISTQKIVPENSKLSDLDPELRQTVEKMMFDQEQKARGLPTSDQMRQHEILQNFKTAHPEMDFSQAKINWGSGGMSGF